MAILTKGHTYGATDTVTSTNLHALVENAAFASGAYDNVTIGKDVNGALYIISVGTGQLANDAVTPAKVDLDNSGVYAFKNAAAQVHYTNQIALSHSAAGALTIDIAAGNFRFINVSANITSVANITNASQLYGGHFTLVLKYSGAGLTGPADGDWGDQWYFPSTFDGTLTMTNNSFDLISGVIANNGGTPAYFVNSVKNFRTFS